MVALKKKVKGPGAAPPPPSRTDERRPHARALSVRPSQRRLTGHARARSWSRHRLGTCARVSPPVSSPPRFSMATAISLRHAPLIAPRAWGSGRLVRVSAARASVPRGGSRAGRRSLSVSAAAGGASGSAPVASAPAWDALGAVSVLTAGTGDAVPLTDLWDPTEVLARASS
jgi:hypothetical protein